MGCYLSSCDGQVYYRTRSLSRPRAFSFAKCVDANSRFTNVSVVQATSGAGWHVVYQPASQMARHRLYLVEYRARELRAAVEGADYRFSFSGAAGRPAYRCLSKSGATYHVTPCSCSCPDFQKRGIRSGIPCKHRQALQMQLDAGVAL